MSEIQDPSYLANGCVTAQGDRQVLSSLVCEEGIALGASGGGDLAVTQRGAGANMSVDVASGNAFVQGDTVGWQGMYHVSNDATENITIPAADPTNPRIDLIVAQVRDSQYAGATDDWSLDVVSGTAAPAPVAPATPASALVLAHVAVAASAASIVNANITDMREAYIPCSGGGRWVTNPLDATIISGNTTAEQTDAGTHTTDWSLTSDEWTYNGTESILAQVAFNVLWTMTGYTGVVSSWLEINGTRVLTDVDQAEGVTTTTWGNGASAALVINPGDVLRVRLTTADTSGSVGMGGGVFSAAALSPA